MIIAGNRFVRIHGQNQINNQTLIMQPGHRGWPHVLWASLHCPTLLEGSYRTYVATNLIETPHDQVPVLLVFVLLLMFVLILVAGYRVRLPFFLGDISPGFHYL